MDNAATPDSIDTTERFVLVDRPSFKEDAAHYLQTHHHPILTAMQIARHHALVDLDSGIDDRAYWNHEIRALQQVLESTKK